MWRGNIDELTWNDSDSSSGSEDEDEDGEDDSGSGKSSEEAGEDVDDPIEVEVPPANGTNPRDEREMDDSAG